MRKRIYVKEELAWKNMWRRCSNPKDKNYSNYGGRGITICERWKSLDNFLYDMGKSLQGFELERKDNSDNYYPLNCAWASKAQNSQNRRTTKLSAEKIRLLRALFKSLSPNQSKLSQYKVLAPLFGVSWMSIYNVAVGITWKAE